MGPYEFGSIPAGLDRPTELHGMKILIYPNPLSRSTNLEYELQKPGVVILDIYDHTGRRVHELLEVQTQGLQRVSWNPGNNPAGFYYFTLQADGRMASGKLVVVK
jgi:hypothetical protein